MQKFEEQLLLHVLVLKMPQVERLVVDLMQITPGGGGRESLAETPL